MNNIYFALLLNLAYFSSYSQSSEIIGKWETLKIIDPKNKVIKGNVWFHLSSEGSIKIGFLGNEKAFETRCWNLDTKNNILSFDQGTDLEIENQRPDHITLRDKYDYRIYLKKIKSLSERIELKKDNANTIIIDKKNFIDYPAATLDLSTNKITINYVEKQKPYTDTPGLFIEPRDREVSISRGRNGNFTGDLCFFSNNLDIIDYNLLNDIPFKEKYLPKNEIKNGAIFVVKTNNNLLFKFKIEAINYEKEQIILTYIKLN
ncbi:hypothetical protein [Aquimarina litoralis]|uniref:hypothetical protein n=1 Tax=Aquimarina litoralis TaxID=584605 RepID=UPI001C57E653|nr:hypothetical protein [Aquimarina litoralis]MBW1295365.1 hypothetical protein [Aquimarina litoralis]